MKQVWSGKQVLNRSIRLACIGALFSTVFLAGCSSLTEADKVTSAYLEAVKQKEFGKALTFISPEGFGDNMSRTDWAQTLVDLNLKLGDLNTYRMTSWNVHREFGVGTYYVLEYQVEYSKYLAVETFTLSRDSSGGGFLICGYDINSVGFLRSE